MDQGTAADWTNLLPASRSVEAFPYVIYKTISQSANYADRGFDLADRQGCIRVWRSLSYPSVDVNQAILDKPIEALCGTWTAVSDLFSGYFGVTQAYVLDDWLSDEALSVSESVGFCYIRRPDLHAYKKSGNQQHAFTQYVKKAASLAKDPVRAS
jgi:hypothetical protein